MIRIHILLRQLKLYHILSKYRIGIVIYRCIHRNGILQVRHHIVAIKFYAPKLFQIAQIGRFQRFVVISIKTRCFIGRIQYGNNFTALSWIVFNALNHLRWHMPRHKQQQRVHRMVKIFRPNNIKHIITLLQNLYNLPRIAHKRAVIFRRPEQRHIGYNAQILLNAVHLIYFLGNILLQSPRLTMGKKRYHRRVLQCIFQS